MGHHGTHLELRGLHKAIGARTILHAINLDVNPGEFIAVVGKSGCGKTTLLRLIAGLAPPSSGQVAVDGGVLRGLNNDARLMFQDARLLPWRRVTDNVGLGLKGGSRGQAEAALAQVGLRDRAADWPAGLSGGERQRVALARALVTSPRLLLLDEPLGALDALTRIEMQQLLERIWQEQRFTAVLVTHDVEEAVALADRVLLIEGGKVALNLPIDLPRPRRRGSPEFAALKEEVLRRVLGQDDYAPPPASGTPGHQEHLRAAAFGA